MTRKPPESQGEKPQNKPREGKFTLGNTPKGWGMQVGLRLRPQRAATGHKRDKVKMLVAVA